MEFKKNDTSLIFSRLTKTGYDPTKDMEEMGQDFHAGDDNGYSIVALSELSDKAQESILTQKGVLAKLPEKFHRELIQIKFKWNIEWGDWSDILYNGKKIWDFESGLPWCPEVAA